MAAVRIDAILLRSSEPERLARFYRAAFELPEPIPDGDGHLGFKLTNVYLGIERTRVDDAAGRSATELWFRVEDVDASHELLLSLGARARTGPDAECSPGETLATLLDPDGNTVGLVGP